jgi:hypothetical protein
VAQKLKSGDLLDKEKLDEQWWAALKNCTAVASRRPIMGEIVAAIDNIVIK